MKKLLIATLITMAVYSSLIFLWLVTGAMAQVGPPNTIQCNQLSLTQPSVSASTIAIISGVSGKITAICGWHVTSSSTTPATFVFSQGPGANCSATPVSLTPTENVTSNAPSADHIDYAGLSIPSGNNICANISTTAVSVGVWFSQF